MRVIDEKQIEKAATIAKDDALKIKDTVKILNPEYRDLYFAVFLVYLKFTHGVIDAKWGSKLKTAEIENFRNKDRNREDAFKIENVKQRLLKQCNSGECTLKLLKTAMDLILLLCGDTVLVDNVMSSIRLQGEINKDKETLAEMVVEIEGRIRRMREHIKTPQCDIYEACRLRKIIKAHERKRDELKNEISM